MYSDNFAKRDLVVAVTVLRHQFERSASHGLHRSGVCHLRPQQHIDHHQAFAGCNRICNCHCMWQTAVHVAMAGQHQVLVSVMCGDRTRVFATAGVPTLDAAGQRRCGPFQALQFGDGDVGSGHRAQVVPRRHAPTHTQAEQPAQ
eukprot:EW705846.1.p2 GENE.EW705846.1~~EW705846.1.p2  ORF type:complete len:145 (-),score=24.82 EW705846.1:104-538(-)